MTITAVQVEASGWVLAVTFAGTLGTFASYTLDASGTPRVTLASSHPGYVPSGGTAVSGTIARSTVAMRPLRLPVNPASPTVAVIDETALGGGSIKVRLALSETIYATDTSLSLAVLAGWRTGEAAQSGISVTNSSTAVAPIPIFRWVLPPYDVTSGAFTASLFVVSHHPVGFQPVAGVKFTVTDGTNTKTVWATALATDNTYGDNLRCYTVTLDPTTATALTAGLLRVDAEVYPFLGSMRSTDTAGTRSMTGMATAALNTAAAAPWVIGYDPAGTRYSSWFAYVDPVNGTTTASAAMICASHALAKAIAPASRPVSVGIAIQAMYLVNRTLAAANGGSSQTHAADGLKIRLAAGTHVGIAGGNVTTGLTVSEIPILIEGDPDDSDPRTNCIWQTGTSSTTRAPRLRLRRMNVQVGTVALVGSTTTQWFLDDMTVSGKAGLETNTIYAFTATVTAGLANIFATKTKYWRTGSRLGSANGNVGLTRAVEHSRALNILAGVKNRFIPASEDTTVVGATNSYQTNGITGGTTDLGLAEDIVFAFCDARGCSGQSWSSLPAAAATAGTSFLSYRRHAIVNNIFERIGSYSAAMASYGEDQTVTVSYLIMEGNTVVGDRWNAYYSDPDVVTLTDVNTKYNEAFCIRHANNVFDWNPTKQDDFNDPQSQTIRGTNGYRPQMIYAWGPHNGTGLEANVDTRRAAGANYFPRDFDGLRSSAPTTGTLSPAFAADRSFVGTNAGLGDYTPGSGSPLLSRITRGNSDRDWANQPRLVNGAAGAIESASILIVPNPGTIAVFGAAGVLVAAPSLSPANATIGLSGSTVVLRATAGLVPAAGVLSITGSAASIIASLTLIPDPGTMSFTGLAATLLVAHGYASTPPAPRVIILQET
jgi:hypothetical protein